MPVINRPKVFVCWLGWGSCRMWRVVLCSCGGDSHEHHEPPSAGSAGDDAERASRDHSAPYREIDDGASDASFGHAAAPLRIAERLKLHPPVVSARRVSVMRTSADTLQSVVSAPLSRRRRRRRLPRRPPHVPRRPYSSPPFPSRAARCHRRSCASDASSRTSDRTSRRTPRS